MAVTAAAAAYKFATVNHRNNVLANLAASDAFHDFDDMGRVKIEGDMVKNVMPKIWKDEKKIGTLPDPTIHKSEEALFEELIGVPISTFRTPGKKGILNILSASPNTIEYEWETVVAYEIVGQETRYKPSIGLFNAITGSSAEKVAYFMIDAINVSIHKALIHDAGAQEKKLVYLETRERLNDPADNRRMDPYVKNSEKSKVTLSILYDEYPHRIVYPRITAGAVEPSLLFNSIFTLSLEAKKSKEGLASSTLTFRRESGDLLKTVTVQNGTVENDNSVNSLYQRLVNFFRGAKTPTALEDYFIALQQKRSGDWLQVLAALDARRFPSIPASAPIFLASLDRLCILYGLCVGANMIYTFQQGNSYCFTVFRRKQKLSAKKRLEENAVALQNILKGHLGTATSLEKAPIVAGGISYSAAVGLYLRFVASKIAIYKSKIQETFAALVPQYGALSEGRFSDEGAFNAPLSMAIKPLYDLLLFSRAFPPTLEAIAKVELTVADIKADDDSLHRAATRIQIWEYVVAMLRDLFLGAEASWSTSEEAMGSALEAQFKKFDASNRERDKALETIDMKEDLYDQPILAVFQQLETFLPATLLAPMAGLFDAMLKKANTVLSASTTPIMRTRAGRLRMNAAIGKYVLLKNTAALPGAALQPLSKLLESVFVNSTPDRKKNAFAVHRVIAKAYNDYVASKMRGSLIQAFRVAYLSAGAGAGAAAATAIATQQGGQLRTGTLVRRKQPVAGSLPSLFLAGRVLKEMAYHRDAHPFEVSPYLYETLARLMAPESVEKVRSMLPPGIPQRLFRATYYEAIAYFVFFMLPDIYEFGNLASVFSQFDIDHVKELGGILQQSILGTAVREEPHIEAEYMRYFEFIASNMPPGAGPEGMSVEDYALEALKLQEKLLVGLPAGPRTPTRSCRTRRPISLKRGRSRSTSRSASASKTRKAKRSRKATHSRTKSATPRMDVEVAAH